MPVRPSVRLAWHLNRELKIYKSQNLRERPPPPKVTGVLIFSSGLYTRNRVLGLPSESGKITLHKLHIFLTNHTCNIKT